MSKVYDKNIFIEFGFDSNIAKVLAENIHREYMPNSEYIKLSLNNKKYRLYIMMSVIIGGLIGIILALYNLLKIFVFSIFEKDFFYFFLRLKVFDIRIGDMIASSVLKDGTDGYLEHSMFLYKIYFKQVIKFVIFIIFVKILKIRFNGKKYFINIDKIYEFENIRRLLIKENFKEISFNQISGKFEIFNENYLGSDFFRYVYATKYIEKISSNDYKQAEESIMNIVNREKTYSFLENCDVDVEFAKDNFNVNQFISINDKVAIIYMHNVSDAQYIFGLDEFTDLHDWLISSVEILNSNNFKVIIKAHPSFHGDHGLYPVDIKYLNYLSKYFSVDLWNLSQHELNKTNMNDVYFIYHKVSSKVLSKLYQNHLCITHHGKVALELGYLGHVVLLSDASPYFKETDKFVMIYDTINEYKEKIKNWKIGMTTQYSQEEIRKSIARYVWIYQMSIGENIYNELVSKFDNTTSKKEIEKYLVEKGVFK